MKTTSNSATKISKVSEECNELSKPLLLAKSHGETSLETGYPSHVFEDVEMDDIKSRARI